MGDKSVPVLRKDHSLKDRDVLPVVLALREFKGELPSPVARMRPGKELASMSEEDLVAQTEGLMGQDLTSVLSLAGIEGAEQPETVGKDLLVFILHQAILLANAKGQPRGVKPVEDRTERGRPSSPISKGPKGAKGAEGGGSPPPQHKPEQKEPSRKVRDFSLPFFASSVNDCGIFAS